MEKLKSIKFLMILYFTTIITIGMVFVAVIFYEKFKSTAQDYAIKSVDQLIMQVKYTLDNYTRNMMDVSNTLYYKIIKNKNIVNNSFSTEMDVIQTTNNNIATLAIFNESGELIAASKDVVLRDEVDVTQQDWFERAIDKPENIHFSNAHRQNLFKEYDPLVVSLSRVISLNEDGRIIRGVLLVDMNLRGIEAICEPISEGDIGDVYIIAPDGGVIYGEENYDLLNEYKTKADNLLDGIYPVDKEQRLLSVKTGGYTGWKIIGVWQLDKVIINYGEIRNFLVLSILAVLVMCILGTFYISNRLSSPLYKLQKSMKLVEQGNFDIRIEEGGEYVVRELSKTFNKMVQRIRELMDEIVKEQDDKRKKELDVLQSQINPHFLYNTLDSIIWLVEDERISEATQMITALSRFFRIGISSGRTVITVREELEHVRNYLAIQKIRYKNKFDFKIEADPKALEAKTIKLILQPLIENALYHGIEYIQHKGEILIEAYVEDNNLIYKIHDNGVGMTEETKNRIFDADYKVKTKGSGVGVKNVNQRIQLYYGPDYGMRIESELEEGTTVYIKMPLCYE
ncbi:MAG: histidine kinase [Epulopiscium sp.]|nr:histidine kinase [Candidatus Epulonipiscium sp.]